MEAMSECLQWVDSGSMLDGNDRPRADASLNKGTGSGISIKIGYMHPLMNDTKWDELRRAMDELGDLTPRWRTRDVENGYISEWDREWFHHFRNGGYKFIQWVEIAVDTAEQRAAVLAELVRIHIPGEQTESGYRVVGYVKTGEAVDYIGS